MTNSIFHVALGILARMPYTYSLCPKRLCNIRGESKTVGPLLQFKFPRVKVPGLKPRCQIDWDFGQ